MPALRHHHCPQLPPTVRHCATVQHPQHLHPCNGLPTILHVVKQWYKLFNSKAVSVDWQLSTMMSSNCICSYLLSNNYIWCSAVISATRQLYNNVAWQFYQLYLLSNNYICCSTVISAVWQLYTLSSNFIVSYTCCPTITHLLYNSCI